MMKLSDQLFKRKVDEAEKEFTFTEFLNLVDSNTGDNRPATFECDSFVSNSNQSTASLRILRTS